MSDLAPGSLAALATPIGKLPPAEILTRFVSWSESRGLTPYPAQEEAFLELLEGKHVVLATPTGSGKSLVALLLHFKALCEGARSFYTSPIKALVSEKFFSLCNDFGAANVGMLTGDASINAGAPIVCCTAEVLANMALRRGESLDVPYAVLDEFHFYGDPARGWAWQVPLLLLPRTTFLLMSATLGDTTPIRLDLARRTHREVALVTSDDRPVPLDFAYCETPLHETVEALLEAGKAPIYVVSFTQRETAELAQSLTSIHVATREQRDAIQRALGDFAFDSPYGKDVARLVRAGIGIHHAGLLPKYRLLVEQLSQQGLLRVIAGTDTLGVGVNIPIRTVLFSKLAKFDGRRVGVLSAREFRQIAGRAGRKGFDERGSVVCQAPEHVIENLRLKARASKGKKKEVTKKPPPGFVGWNKETFERLIGQTPDPLVSRFRVTHGMLVLLLRQGEEDPDPRRGWRLVARLIRESHSDERQKGRLLRSAAQLFRGLRAADIVRVERDPASGRRRVRVAGDLQWDFSLHHALSLYVVEALSYVEADDEAYGLEVLSLVEAVLEDPRVLLLRQLDRIKSDLFQRLKAEGVPYEERMARLEEVQSPAPSRAFIEQTFEYFARRHPWVRHEDVRPKSIARELYEGYYDFDHYVRFYGLQRSEGLLLRYLGEVYGTLVQTVPEGAKTEAVHDVIAYFRALLERVDSSLVKEWENLLHPELRESEPAAPLPSARVYDLAADERALRARVRAELHGLVRALAAHDWQEAARCVHPTPDDPWTPERFQRALAPFFAEYESLVFTPRARTAEWTRFEPEGARRWRATQTLLDPDDDNMWCVEAEVDLNGERDPVGPLLRMTRISS
jgi:superfamily II RNA helicase